MFYDQIISGEVYLRLDKVPDEANKITEIKLMIPGSTLFAKAQCKSFEEGTDLTVESLKKQINKHKEKIKAHESNHKEIILQNIEQAI